jgi:WD40 repeat protein
MNLNRTRDAILAGIGLIALLVYVLACTSFSPDDSKILFPSLDPKSGNLALALYDRETGRTEHLLSLPLPKEEGSVIRPVWTPDGQRVVALWPDESGRDGLRVMVLPLKTREPIRVLALRGQKELTASLVVPPAIVGSHLFMAAGSQVLRLDLESGEVKTNGVQGEIILLGQRERVYYLRDVSARLEVGRLDIKNLTCVPLFQTPEKSGGDVKGFAVSRDGSRVALLGGKEDAPAFLIFDGKDLTRTIPLAAKGDDLAPGNFVWSSDGSTLYAAYVKSQGAGKSHACGVLEVPVDGRPARQLPLFNLAGSLDESDPYLFQIDLSHDGKTLATCSTYLSFNDDEKLKPEDLALYLIDLSRPDRKVTKVPVPAPIRGGAATQRP